MDPTQSQTGVPMPHATPATTQLASSNTSSTLPVPHAVSIGAGHPQPLSGQQQHEQQQQPLIPTLKPAAPSASASTPPNSTSRPLITQPYGRQPVPPLTPVSSSATVTHPPPPQGAAPLGPPVRQQQEQQQPFSSPSEQPHSTLPTTTRMATAQHPGAPTSFPHQQQPQQQQQQQRPASMAPTHMPALIPTAPTNSAASSAPSTMPATSVNIPVTTAAGIVSASTGQQQSGKGEQSRALAPNSNKGSVPAFISKLMTMLNDPNTDHLISWTENGQTFKVHDAATLAKEVLPRFFKHSNFTSLVRQLNMYGFHKVVGVDSGGLKTASDQVWEFVHPCVQRDKPHLLCLVKRKEGSSTRKKLARKDVDSVMHDLHAIKGEQAMLTSRFQDMQRQNAALWQEVTQLRRKHEHQQRMISKIMMFLSRVVRHQQLQTINGPASKRAKTLALEPFLEEAINDEPEHTVTTSAPPASTWEPPAPTTVASSHAGSEQPEQPPSYQHTTGMNDRFLDLTNSERLADVENLIGPELNSYDDRLQAQKDRLAQGGFDSSLLSSLWAAAGDEAEGGHDPNVSADNHAEFPPLTPPTTTGQVTSPSWTPGQQAVMYSPLDFDLASAKTSPQQEGGLPVSVPDRSSAATAPPGTAGNSSSAAPHVHIESPDAMSPPTSTSTA